MNKVAKVTWWAVAALVALVVISLLLARGQ
jgi:hypothetical protein